MTSLYVRIVEAAIGKQLPSGAMVHHVDGDRKNNANSNLVVCENQAYHMLIHRRTRALEQSGDANNVFCTLCQKWDKQEHMKLYGRSFKHVECNRSAALKYYYDNLEVCRLRGREFRRERRSS